MKVSEVLAAAGLFLLLILVLLWQGGCQKKPEVKITTAPATINGESMKWDGGRGLDERAGFNFEVLHGFLNKARVWPHELFIDVRRDDRQCGLSRSAVTIGGVATYRGQQYTFYMDLDEPQRLSRGTPGVTEIRRKCNRVAARALAVGIIRALRSAGVIE